MHEICDSLDDSVATIEQAFYLIELWNIKLLFIYISVWLYWIPLFVEGPHLSIISLKYLANQPLYMVDIYIFTTTCKWADDYEEPGLHSQ